MEATRVMVGLPGKTTLRSSVAILPLFLGLLLLSGCAGEGYPENLAYARRTDPLPATPPTKDAPGLDRPGEFPEILFVGLSEKEKEQGKLLDDPSKLKADQREELDEALSQIFGTPAHPRVGSDQASKSVKKLSEDLRLDEETLAK